MGDLVALGRTMGNAGTRAGGATSWSADRALDRLLGEDDLTASLTQDWQIVRDPVLAAARREWVNATDAGAKAARRCSTTEPASPPDALSPPLQKG